MAARRRVCDAVVALNRRTAPADGDQRTVETRNASSAEEAKAALPTLVALARLRCVFVRKVGHGSYQGRRRRVDDRDAGLNLLRDGWARPDADASENYRAAEAKMKAAKRGRWASVAD